ncbi:hypothetical protein MKJ01_03755 [Chryseobacterium sp. SSA4.19]|uniref:hypothetical protein n=1 Tax=Chryseobacterium sp. SSA4.19 TaxID=2919915 RepID=UPI001F4ED514|nr:hypothetical protein [Chryseobacterium sp. SSA4.19]MCJ8152879.1 hypothetical protein [Chryseobacterium sp. SSA4.19]
MKDFDIEKLERKNIYRMPDDLFNTIQEKVIHDVKANKKAPVFKLNWVYAAAASLALIFGATFVFNSYNETAKDSGSSQFKNMVNNSEKKTESQIAYETLKSDLTSVESDNQTMESGESKRSLAKENKAKKTLTGKTNQTAKPVSKENEAQMNAFLDSFTNSEISELASNSTQDVYLDLYN